jgi:hypothetical protein
MGRLVVHPPASFQNFFFGFSQQKRTKKENTSYSAMLNIAEISSAPESIPLIPESLESLAIPEFRTTPNDSGIAQRIRIIFKSIHNSEIIIIILILELDGIPGNSVQFRAIPKLTGSGIAQWNRIIFKSAKDSRMIIILLIPEFRAIPCNPVQFRSILEFHPHPHLSYCACRYMSWTRERFRNCNDTEFPAIPCDSVLFRN